MPSIGEYLAGAAFLSLVLGLCAAAGLTLARRALPGAGAGLRALAAFTLGSGAVVVSHGVPGAIGVLGRPAVAACALALAAAARLAPAARAVPAPLPAAEPEVPATSRAMALAGVLAATGAGFAALAAHAPNALTSVDSLTTYLPQAAQYLQEDSFGSLAQFIPDWANATYPQNGTMVLLAGLLPWDSAFAVRFLAPPFLVATAGAVFLLARELRAPVTTAALAAAAVGAMPHVALPALEHGVVDPLMLAWFAAGALFLLRSARSGSGAELALAAAGLGLAFGTKWYAVVYVPVLVGFFLLATRGRGLVTLAGGIALLGGGWLVRNWVLTGNPVHPVPVRLFGMTVFDAPPDLVRGNAGFTVSDYLLDGTVLREWLVPAWLYGYGLLGPLLLVAIVVASVVAIRRRSRIGGVLVAAATVMGALYTVIPDTALGPPGMPVLAGANARYLAPALLAAAVAAAWLAVQGPRWRLAVEAALLIGVLESVVRSHDAALVLAPPAAAAAAGTVYAARRWPGRAAIAGAALLLLGGLAVSRTATPEDYGDADPVIARLLAERPDSVGLGGVWTPGGISPVLPSFGPRLRARVRYLGEFEQGTMRRPPDAAGFTRLLRAGRFDAVVVGADGPEANWAQAAGMRRAAESPRLVLLLP